MWVATCGVDWMCRVSMLFNFLLNGSTFCCSGSGLEESWWGLQLADSIREHDYSAHDSKIYTAKVIEHDLRSVLWEGSTFGCS